MVITVFGLGFVGLTTALGFAHMGHTVYGLEANKERMDIIKTGKLPFLEPGLDDALTKHLQNCFYPTDNIKEAVTKSRAVYYCVGTPYGEDGQADLKYLYAALDQTLAAINDNEFRVLTIKSTVPPGTTATKVIPYLEDKGAALKETLGIANNPEFLREGHCWDDFLNADRIVLGVNDAHSEEILREVYAGVDIPIHCVSHATGEFIKYLSNTLLATLISYANEMSVIADTLGDIDTANAFRILLEDKRWHTGNMRTYAYPGCGYGGYCLPKDTNALYAAAKMKGLNPRILENVIRMNDEMPDIIAARIKKLLGKEQPLGILGLSFKPGSDDVRDSPAAKVIRALLKDDYKNILAYDPVASDEFKKIYPDMPLKYCKSMGEVIDRSDAFAILTAWPEFKALPELTGKPILDGRYML